MRGFLLSFGLAMALLAGPTSTAHAQVDDPMPDAQAAKYYLSHACKNAAAGDRYTRAVFKRREHHLPGKRRSDACPNSPACPGSTGKSTYVWALDLLHPPTPWPDSVAELTTGWPTETWRTRRRSAWKGSPNRRGVDPRLQPRQRVSFSANTHRRSGPGWDPAPG